MGERLSKIKQWLYKATAGVVTVAFLVANAGYASAEQTRVRRPKAHTAQSLGITQPSLDQKLTELYKGVEPHVLAEQKSQEAEMPYTSKNQSNIGDVVSNDLAVDVYTKLGTIDFKEGGIKEGHKFLTALGLNLTYGDKFKKTVNAEIWCMGEPLDEDVELPHNGYRLAVEGSYPLSGDGNITFFPFGVISYDRWERNNNPKYENSFSDLDFLSGTVGIMAEKGIYHVKIGGLLPFWSKTDKGQNLGKKLGFDTSAGVKYKRVSLDVFFKETRFGEDAGQPDMALRLYGIMIGGRF